MFSITYILKPLVLVLYIGRTSSFCIAGGNCEISVSKRRETVAYYSAPVKIYQQCCNLCASIDRCASLDYDVTTRMCHLYSDRTKDSNLKKSTFSVVGNFTPKTGKTSKNVCRTRPCKQHQICVMTSSGDNYICLRGSVCSNPPPIHQLTSQLDFNTLSTGQASYQCELGYLAQSGSGVSVCDVTSGWTPPSLTCAPIDCGHPPDISQLTLTSVTSTSFQSEGHYACAVGYNKTDGEGLTICLDTGHWSHPTISCKVIDCGSPLDIAGMTVAPVTSPVYDSQTTFTCLDGFESNGADGNITCQASSLWTSPALKCTRKDCKMPPTFSNMATNFTSTLFESEAVYSCAVGYISTSGTGISICRSDASWEPPTLVCEIVDCGHPPTLPNMTLGAIAETTYEKEVDYACAVGYYAGNGTGTSTCQADGSWTLPTLDCPVVDCGPPVEYTGYDVASYNSTEYGGSATYRCRLGQTSPDFAVSSCQVTGTWTPVSLTCRAISGVISQGISQWPNTSLECVSRLSSPGLSVSLECEQDEVLAGCSTLGLENTTVTRGQLTAYGACHSYGTSDVQAVARCCKQRDFQCEHIRKITETACVKDFHLLDCVCAATANNRHCSMDHINNTCVPSPVSRPYNTYYIAVCCVSPTLSCYKKPLEPDRDQLSIACGVNEVIVGCSGYNYDTNIQGAIVEDVGGTNMCVIKPGLSNITTLTGYAHCCTSP